MALDGSVLSHVTIHFLLRTNSKQDLFNAEALLLKEKQPTLNPK